MSKESLDNLRSVIFVSFSGGQIKHTFRKRSSGRRAFVLFSMTK